MQGTSTPFRVQRTNKYLGQEQILVLLVRVPGMEQSLARKEYCVDVGYSTESATAITCSQYSSQQSSPFLH
jgi:hypothetical protein